MHRREIRHYILWTNEQNKWCRMTWNVLVEPVSIFFCWSWSMATLCLYIALITFRSRVKENPLNIIKNRPCHQIKNPQNVIIKNPPIINNYLWRKNIICSVYHRMHTDLKNILNTTGKLIFSFLFGTTHLFASLGSCCQTNKWFCFWIFLLVIFSPLWESCHQASRCFCGIASWRGSPRRLRRPPRKTWSNIIINHHHRIMIKIIVIEIIMWIINLPVYMFPLL